MSKKKDLLSSVKVIDTIYSIEYFKSLLEVDPDQKDRLLGYIDRKDCEIRLYEPKSKQGMLATFIHELIHGICDKAGLEELDEKENEIDSIAINMAAILKDNYDLFKYIIKEW